MKDLVRWKDFVQKMKQIRGWTIKRSPVIWEILTSQKGKVSLIGDIIDDLCEYVQAFFGVTLDNDCTPALLHQVALNKEGYRRGFQGFDRGNKSTCSLAHFNGSQRLLGLILTDLLSPVSSIPKTTLLDIRQASSILVDRLN